MSNGSAGNLDEVLKRLAERIAGGGTQPQPPETTATAGYWPSPSPAPEASPPAADGASMMQFRDLLATELAYMQMIPPLTPEARLTIDRSMRSFAEAILFLRDSPHARARLDTAITLAAVTTTAASQETGERMTPRWLPILIERLRKGGSTGPYVERSTVTLTPDAELVAVADRVTRDLLGDQQERIVPAAVILIGAGLGGAATGVTIGAAAKKAWNKLFD